MARKEASRLVKQGAACRKAGDYSNAVTAYQEAITLMSDTSTKIPCYLAIGDMLIETKRYEAAIEAYTSIVELEPEHRQALLNLGECLVILKRDEEAAKVFDRWLETNPTDVVVLHQAAMTHFRLKNLERGENYLETVEKLDGSEQYCGLHVRRRSRSVSFEIVEIERLVCFTVGAWSYDGHLRYKEHNWPFKWKGDQVLWVIQWGHERIDPVIGYAITQEMAIEIAKQWLVGWLIHCDVPHHVLYDRPVEITGTNVEQVLFRFLVQCEDSIMRSSHIEEASFAWKDKKVFVYSRFLLGAERNTIIGHAKQENKAKQVAQRWLEKRIGWEQLLDN